jgi:parallel beta-helix repeat protein
LISPILFKYHRLNTLQVKQTSLELARYTVSSLSILSLVGVCSITVLGTIPGSVLAQIPPVSETTISQVNVVFVNPSAGDDTTGNGSESTPFKTITQALKLANPGTVIKLTPGNYSAETGEMFPLMLKSGVSIQGDTSNKGRGIIIQGGGQFLSRSFGGQNVTIISGNQAGLVGVTVTNPNPRGYGLWIESSNPVVSDNTFTGNTQDGISVTGNSAATITKNYFYRNGANGITIGGNSSAQVRENVFEETGFGINVAQNAAPLLVSNRIENNRSGVIVQANARPVLRNNLIQGSKEDGLVAIAQAMPDLGNNAEVGGNQFSNNARYDINANAAKQIVVAVGNTINSKRIAGKVSLTAQDAPVANATTNSVLSAAPNNGEIVFTAPTIANTTNRPTQPVVSNQGNNQLPALVSADSPLTISRYNQQPPAAIANRVTNQKIPANIPKATSTIKLTPVPTVRTGTAQLNYVQVDPHTIEFVAPQAPQSTVENTSVLPVPAGNVPLGNTRNMRRVSAPQASTTAPSNYLAASTGASVRYRVVVEATNDREQEIVKSLAPEAFSTIWQGRRVMQVGVFSDRNNADEMQRILNSSGLRTIVEPLN